MRVLVIGLNYAPDLIGIAKYTSELCEDLVRRGHQVEVVTAPPYYPGWRVPADYQRGQRRYETLNGVAVRRVRFYVPAEPTGLKRLLHLASFALSVFSPAIGRALAFKPDIVLTVAPALFSAPAALLAARCAGAKSWLHIQDFEVDAAFELGMLKGPKARRAALAFERAILNAFDLVSTISPKMVERLIEKGVPADRTAEVRNWVDVDGIQARSSTDTEYRHLLSIPSESPVLMYSGNMSAKQGLDILAAAAKTHADASPQAVFMFVGNGPYRTELERACTGLGNVRFLDLQPAERVSELLATADIHLIPQRAEAADLVLPSKLPPILSSGRPCIVMAMPGTSLCEEVGDAGLVVRPGDALVLIEAIDRLLRDPESRKRMGTAARVRAEQRWRREMIMDKVEALALKERGVSF